MWGAVDETFRITPTLEKTIANKQAEFKTQIQKAIPGITDDYIEQLRRAVAGEVNKGREALIAPAVKESVSTDSVPQTVVQPESGVVASSTNGAA